MATNDTTDPARTAAGQDPIGWELTVVVSGQRPHTHQLPLAGRVVIGRGDAADIVIDDASVSRRHAVLVLAPGGVSVEDLDSANGTRIVNAAPASVRTAETQAESVPPGAARAVPDRAAVHLGSVVLLCRPREAPRHAELVPGLVARSASIQRVLELLGRVAPSSLSVLLVGETGVGKDVLARALHAASPRRTAPFVAINCAAIAEHLVESELFGHEKGAFTGAAAAKVGLLEAADGGTAFLDEVGELPLVQQSKLLRALEAREVLRVGATKPRPIDVRFVAATNKDPGKDAERGTFRKDLYFRLSGITLAVPPLRERKEDLEPLAASFAERAAEALRVVVPTLSPAALEVLHRHSFPGNVRELRNVIERAVALASDGEVRPEHLLMEPAAAESEPPAGDEKTRIVRALADCGGNQTRAAALLGISRRTLVTRIADYGLARPHGSRE